MARNRRTQSAEVHPASVVKALLLCLFIGGAGVGFVCQKSQLVQLGRQKKAREMQLEQLRLRNAQLARQLWERQSVPALERRARELKLDLTVPHPSRIVTLEDRLSASPRRPADSQLAQQDRPSPSVPLP
jgi:uncharacterized protein HemX